MSQEILSQKLIEFVEHAKEIEDINKLIEQVKPYIDSSTVIVNCRPEMSSIICQVLNHKLSYLNNNSLYEQISILYPEKGMNKVWDRCAEEYLLYDKYLTQWVAANMSPDLKYLFVDAKMDHNYSKLRAAIRDRSLDYRFATLYCSGDASPDYCVGSSIKKPVFQWENLNNTNY